METYKSRYSAEDLDNTIGLVHGLVVPHVGENGNWFVGNTDTGVFAKGIDVTGADIGQIVKITEIDSDGRPLAWEAVEIPTTDITLVGDIVLEEETTDITITTDINGQPFELRGYYLYIHCPTAPTQNINSYTYLRIYMYDANGKFVSYVGATGPTATKANYEAMLSIELSKEYTMIPTTSLYRIGIYGNFTAQGIYGNYPFSSLTGPISKIQFATGATYPAGTKIKIFKTK